MIPSGKIRRKVIDVNYVGACRYTGYINKTAELVLECGHTLYRKASSGVPRMAQCRECMQDLAKKETP